MVKVLSVFPDLLDDPGQGGAERLVQHRSADRMEVVTRDNKGGREEATPLHPIAADHLRAVFGIEDRSLRVFPWDCDLRRRYREFQRIQKAAGIELPCSEQHKHTNGCRFYSFHDLRRGFASMNALNMPADALQRLMRHQTYTTTQRYVNLARSMRDIVGRLVVPESARAGGMRERTRETGESSDSAGDVDAVNQDMRTT